MTTHHEETKAKSGTGGLQRKEESAEDKEVRKLRKEIIATRAGHATGGYCETEKLHELEKALWKILSKRLEEAKEKHGYSPDPKFKHPEIRALELELNGFSWRPKLVVADSN